MSRKYVLDANTFIEAQNRYYGFDICPGYWTSLLTQHDSKHVCSIDRIATELHAQDDALKRWIANHVPATFFKKTADHAVITKFGRLANWVNRQPQFTASAKSEFLSNADGWVIAYAAANDLTVVTHEQYAPEARRKVPIPNVCIEFDVDYVDTFFMLRDLRVSFSHNGRRRVPAR